MELSTQWDAEELGSYLLDIGVHEDVVGNIIGNRVTGALFLQLNEDDLKELTPTIGDRIALRKVLEQARNVEELPPTDSQTEGASGQCRISPVPNSRSLLESGSSLNSKLGRNATNSRASSDWHDNFVIPELHTFSQHVKQAILTGVVTGRAKREITQVLRTYMTAHTLYPTSEQYTAVCLKLIQKYPKLMDPDNDTSCAAWKQSLRYSFKNFRRGYVNTRESVEQPSKQYRFGVDEPEESDLSEEEYIEAYKELQQIHKDRKKKGKQSSRVKHLMEITMSKRQKWIQEKSPTVDEVLDKFPHLASVRLMQKEFLAIVSYQNDITMLIDHWLEWKEKIIEVSKLEGKTRPIIKKLVREFDEANCLEDQKDVICLELMIRLIYPRGPGKDSIFFKQIKSSEVEVDQVVAEIPQSEPFILIVGTAIKQAFVCCEQGVLVESKSVKAALTDLIMTYFVFNIAYPKGIHNVLVFLQHYVYNFVDQQKVSPNVKALVNNMKKL